MSVGVIHIKGATHSKGQMYRIKSTTPNVDDHDLENVVATVKKLLEIESDMSKAARERERLRKEITTVDGGKYVPQMNALLDTRDYDGGVDALTMRLGDDIATTSVKGDT